MARGGFPGMGNLNDLMKQAKKMQEQMLKMQQELEVKSKLVCKLPRSSNGS